MYRPPILKDSFTRRKQEKIKIQKLIISFYIVVLMLFGINFDFLKFLKCKIRSIVQFVYHAVAFTSILILFIPVLYVGVDQFWFYFFILQYLGHNLVLYFSKYTVSDYMSDLHTIVKEINGSSNIANRFGIVLIAVTTTLFVLKLSLCGVSCFLEGNLCFEYRLPSVIHCIPACGLDCVLATQLLVYFYVYSSIRYLKVSMIDTEKKDYQLIQRHYCNIANCCDKIRPLLTWMLVIDLTISFPKLLGVIYYMIFYIQTSGWFFLFETFFHFTHSTAQLCSLSIVVQMINNEIYDFNVILQNHLMEEEDEVKSEQIKRLVEYVKARPACRELWGFIPLDLRLPATLFSLCTTYVIVAIQFTHLVE